VKPRVVDWLRWRACPVCPAGLGEACTRMTGAVVKGNATEVVSVEADGPHGGRKERAGATR
jgi:hypothetical protein